PMLGREIDNPPDMRHVKGVDSNAERIGTLLHHGSKCAFELVGAVHVDKYEMQRHARELRDQLLEDLQPFGAHLRAQNSVTGRVCAWSGEIGHQARSDWVVDRDHHNRYCGGRLLRRARGGGSVDRNDVHWYGDEFPCADSESVGVSICRTIFNREVLSLDIAGLPEPLAEVVPDRRVIDDPDALDFCRLLRTRGERPRGCATEQHDELAAPHSITSSARARSVVGASRPSAFPTSGASATSSAAYLLVRLVVAPRLPFGLRG